MHGNIIDIAAFNTHVLEYLSIKYLLVSFPKGVLR